MIAAGFIVLSGFPVLLRGFNADISGHVGVAKGSVFIEGGGNYGFIDIRKDRKNGANKTGAAVVVVG
ncbi:hypothetical protein [Chitinophaga pinensis]|uniref:Uncharacterized protein n=1 Tax=Chitinophaga pinensis (strain ATCC 43595 / DSM 2588 / LMG 13176 / NBRC 15968 / NCIMB 11800 / UQM 2034) TaxID=485918 RepID=A0A979GS26_CHIPD|nr:hypothetical protein [Chitinophaga pinensis]ACU58881.1 hypothetical protein Cpin_1384 [Chitinophaga pinensis DSM 2588]